MLILVSAAALLLAALLTMPLKKDGGVGRIVAFVVLSIVGIAAAQWMVGNNILPTFGDDESEVRVDDGDVEGTIEEMKRNLESEIGVKLLQAPDREALESHHPTVWRFGRGYALLCTPEDFPDSAALICWNPDGLVGGGDVRTEGDTQG